MKKRSVTLKGHATSITLEDEFQTALQALAEQRGQSLAALINHIDEWRLEERPTYGLSSAIRVYILLHRDDHETDKCNNDSAPDF